MANFDVFNGDADGICALLQMRLAEPLAGHLITGVKRDIALLGSFPCQPGDRVTVLDISLDKNREALLELLGHGAQVTYVDHHFAGEIPVHPALRTLIDPDPAVCTSLLVDRMLEGRFRPWAVAAAFGDNLRESALRAAEPLGLPPPRVEALRELGECINYNAYGETVEVLHFHPAELYRRLYAHADPFAFIADDPAFETLRQGFAADLALAEATRAEWATGGAAAFVLPDAPWSRRVGGVYGNRLALAAPARAHAILTRKRGGGYLVSVRAPAAAPTGADLLCRRFASGGGRKGAAGINHLPETELEGFFAAFREAYPTTGGPP